MQLDAFVPSFVALHQVDWIVSGILVAGWCGILVAVKKKWDENRHVNHNWVFSCMASVLTQEKNVIGVLLIFGCAQSLQTLKRYVQNCTRFVFLRYGSTVLSI